MPEPGTTRITFDDWRAMCARAEQAELDLPVMRESCEAATERMRTAEDALRQIEAIQPKVLAMLRRLGIVFDDVGNDPKNWQHCAFTIYTELCEADRIARAALGDDHAE